MGSPNRRERVRSPNHLVPLLYRLGMFNKSYSKKYPSNRMSGFALNKMVVRLDIMKMLNAIFAVTPLVSVQTTTAIDAMNSSTYIPADETAMRCQRFVNRHIEVTLTYAIGVNKISKTPASGTSPPYLRHAIPCAVSWISFSKTQIRSSQNQLNPERIPVEATDS